MFRCFFFLLFLFSSFYAQEWRESFPVVEGENIKIYTAPNLCIDQEINLENQEEFLKKVRGVFTFSEKNSRYIVWIEDVEKGIFQVTELGPVITESCLSYEQESGPVSEVYWQAG